MGGGAAVIAAMVDAARPRCERRPRPRLRAPRRETCRAARRSGPAMCSRCATARRSRSSTPMPKGGSSSPDAALASRSRTKPDANRRPGDAHRRGASWRSAIRSRGSWAPTTRGSRRCARGGPTLVGEAVWPLPLPGEVTASLLDFRGSPDHEEPSRTAGLRAARSPRACSSRSSPATRRGPHPRHIAGSRAAPQ